MLCGIEQFCSKYEHTTIASCNDFIPENFVANFACAFLLVSSKQPLFKFNVLNGIMQPHQRLPE